MMTAGRTYLTKAARAGLGTARKIKRRKAAAAAGAPAKPANSPTTRQA